MPRASLIATLFEPPSADGTELTALPDAVGWLEVPGCRVGDIDLGRSMVASGMAVADGAYLNEEEAARLAKLGIWAGSFTPPAEWRREHGEGMPPAPFGRLLHWLP